MNKNRRIAGLLSVLLILSLSCAPLGQAAATQSVGQKKASPASTIAPVSPTPGPTLPKITASNNPQTLADEITQAASDAERYNALLNIMKSLNLGVYNGKGEAIISGAERGPDDFYLYDFEVSALAWALGRKETTSAADLATQLSEIGITLDGKPFPPEVLLKTLAAVASESIQDPGNPLSLVHLLIHELGLRQTPSYDIAAATSAEQIQFDALQRILIFSDLLVPLGATSAQSSIFQKSAFLVSNDKFNLSPAGLPCSFVGDVSGFKFGKFFVNLMKLPGVSDIMKLAGIGLDLHHGILLGLMMVVQETKASGGIEKHQAHYGPPAKHFGKGLIPGDPIQFQLGVWMGLDLSDFPKLNCGKLVGLTFPPQGPVKGVAIYWDHILYGGVADYALLKEHGTITREDDTTDANGLATLVFQPKDEPDSTIPIRLQDINIRKIHGVLIPGIGLASSFGNVLAFGTDVLIPKIIGMGFDIEFHESKPYRASGPVGEGIWSGVVCSLDQPFTLNILVKGFEMPFKFTPTSPEAGSVTMDAANSGVQWNGAGVYSVQGAGSETPRIVGAMAANASPGGSYGIDINITLTPLDTNECSKP